MKVCRTVCISILSLYAALLLPIQSAQAINNDDLFLVAKEAARTGDRNRLDQLSIELATYDLGPYVEYWRLAAGLKADTPNAAIIDFLRRNEGSFVAEKLRSDWLKQLGKQQQWDQFDPQFALLKQPDQDLNCYALQSRLAKKDNAAMNEALALWKTIGEASEACQPVLETLIWNKQVLADDVWLRIRNLTEANKVAGARYTMNYLPPSQTPDSKAALAVTDNPMPWLAKTTIGGDKTNRELAAIAISRIARNDPRMAVEQLTRLSTQLQDNERGWAWGQIGWRAAQRHMEEALDWYKKAGDTKLSDETAQWKVRAALRAQDWGTVKNTIENMPPALAADPAWVYWLGRAYKAGGLIDKANRLFEKISGQPNFYGNLADEELGRSIAPPPKAAAPSSEEISAIQRNTGVLRAMAFFRLNLRTEGVREWNWALRSMSDRELLAASAIAARAGIYDRAIAAADRTRNEHDYSLRYLSPYVDQIRPAARNQSVDDAWVYGLMRQESRFVTAAKSTVGASGLMQLMPATAKWVANKIGLRDFNASQVNDTDTNVLLGTSYMRMIMESLDNMPVLASAAYNAGPGRARKWMAARPLEGAIYAETIPFAETRDYVKKVMSNAVYYAALFDEKPQSLKNRLGVVNANTGSFKGVDLP